MISERPILNKNLDSSEFKEFYYLKKELVDFFKFECLKSWVIKNNRKKIIYYLETGEILKEVNLKKFTSKNITKISLNSKLGENFTCSQEVREFFKKEIGNNFTFKVPFLNG